MWQICIGYVWVCSFMHINIPSSFAVEMFKYIYSIDICSDFQCILTRKLKIETSSKPLQHTPKAMFHRLMRCNVYNYASTCMFPFRKKNLFYASLPLFLLKIPYVIWLLLWSVIYLDSWKNFFTMKCIPWPGMAWL